MAGAKGLSLAFMAALCISCIQDAGGATFVIQNECAFPVWAASSTGGGKRLDTGHSWTPQAPLGGSTSVTFWGRTGCSFNSSGLGNCITGDCGGLLNCTGALLGTFPITLAEYSYDTYDISLVDGFNLPISIIPSYSTCSATSCTSNITGICPAKLSASGGCKSACDALGLQEYCCTSGYSSTLNCTATNYSLHFKQFCPQAKTYAADNNDVTFKCAADTHYKVIFCNAAPSPTPSAISATHRRSATSSPSPTPSAISATHRRSGIESG
eukprot:PITA_19560